MNEQSNLDLVVGSRAIAAILGLPPKRVNNMSLRGEIPTFKLGGSVAIRRGKLMAWIADLEAAAE